MNAFTYPTGSSQWGLEPGASMLRPPWSWACMSCDVGICIPAATARALRGPAAGPRPCARPAAGGCAERVPALHPSSLGGDPEDGLAGQAAVALGLERLAALGQRPHPTHNRPQLAGIHPAAELGQLDAVGLDDEEHPAGIGAWRPSRCAPDHRDQGAGGPDQQPGPGSRSPTNQVQDQVDLADGVLDPLAVDVDDLLSAQPGQQRRVGGSPGGDDLGAGRGSQLHGQGPDPASRALDEHSVAGLQVAVGRTAPARR
jgi:hypothetical protein